MRRFLGFLILVVGITTIIVVATSSGSQPARPVSVVPADAVPPIKIPKKSEKSQQYQRCAKSVVSDQEAKGVFDKADLIEAVTLTCGPPRDLSHAAPPVSDTKAANTFSTDHRACDDALAAERQYKNPTVPVGWGNLSDEEKRNTPGYWEEGERVARDWANMRAAVRAACGQGVQ
jgi:hypothetical protein